ncbi:DNA polymerase III subunit delta [Helicobacter sp. MIT 99-5507]|uniref:DNA polymerase III subunit delta n=1 Tax=Helicobacter sp. MIT 99-5507 TaxID=152489 RepID=UPI000E1F1D31|nr:hypothetical protein [Helicobacter sp. MIT 99-5507]RDU57961.1 hypothetical protein CQA42_03420 [Helicobacter sp. MIT 99-5507]
MYKKDLDNLLKSSIPKASFLYGECDFLIDYYGKKIKNLIIKNGDIDVFLFYFDEYNKNAIIDIFSQQSLFATSSLVCIKIDSTKIKKGKNNDFKELLDILKNNPQNYLIIEFYNNGSQSYAKDSKAIALYFNNNNFINTRFFKPNTKEALEILQDSAKLFKININQINLAYLYELQNQELGICVNELQKFSVFDREITKSDIDTLSYGLFTNTIDELCDAMLSRREYIKILIKLEEHGIADMEIINTMHMYFYRLFLFFSHIKINGTYNSKDVLGYALPKNIEDKYVQFATRLRESQYLEIFKTLNNWRLFSINGKDKNYLPNLIKIQAIIK